MYAYDSCYLSDVQELVGNMLDYAVYDLHIKLREFWIMFLNSSLSKKISSGDSSTLAGQSGIEIARKVLEQADPTGKKSDASIQPHFRPGRSREYWTGWSITFYQWKTGISFQNIEKEIPILMVLEMYDKYHEMDIRHFYEEMRRISQTNRACSYVKLYRQRLGLSQKEAASEAGIPLRTLQQYEQKQKNINKASAETVIMLARIYGVRPEELLEE